MPARSGGPRHAPRQTRTARGAPASKRKVSRVPPAMAQARSRQAASMLSGESARRSQVNDAEKESRLHRRGLHSKLSRAKEGWKGVLSMLYIGFMPVLLRRTAAVI